MAQFGRFSPVIAAVGLIGFGEVRIPFWGATTFGLIGGLITAGACHFTGSGFRWSSVGKYLVVSAGGLATEVIRPITGRNPT